MPQKALRLRPRSARTWWTSPESGNSARRLSNFYFTKSVHSIIYSRDTPGLVLPSEGVRRLERVIGGLDGHEYNSHQGGVIVDLVKVE